MKNFLNDLLIFVLFVAAIVCFYFGATVAFASALMNLILFFSAVFFLIQAAGLVDKAKGFGKYSQSNSNSTDVSNKVKESPDNPEGNDN